MTDTGGNQANEDVVLADDAAQGVSGSASLAFDPDRYREHLEDCDDLTEEQANELLLAVWEIMKAFVNLGWGVDSIYHVLPDLAVIASETEASETTAENGKAVKQFDSVSSSGGDKEGVQ